MKKTMSGWLAILAAVVMLPGLGLTQPSDLGDRVMALKANIEKDTKVLRTYEWVETTVISMKGDEKSRTENQCYYGADGKEVKVPLSAPPAAGSSRGLKGRMIAHKKEEISDYMKKAVAMIKTYAPPNPQKLQALYQGGKVSAQVLEPGRRTRVEFKDYELPGDSLAIEVNLINNHILGVQIATYLDGPTDKVGLTVKYGELVDGTGYPAQVTLDAPTQKITVVTQNAGYRPLSK